MAKSLKDIYSVVDSLPNEDEVKLNQPVLPDINRLNSYIQRAHDNCWLTNFGQLHDELTQKLCEFLGVKYLLLVNNCTTGLQVAAKVLGGKSALTTPYSFAATSSALNWINIDLHYADILPDTLNMDPAKVEEALSANSEIDLIVPTHVYGNPCDVNALEDIAQRHGKKIIYDAAQCFGVTLNGRSILEYGDASVVSFHATKLFHTCEGGAICFKNAEDYELAKRAINFGFTGTGGLGEFGTNGKLNEYQAAVGLTLLEDIQSVLHHRRALYARYKASLGDVFTLQKWDESAVPNGGYFPIMLNSEIQTKKIESVLKQNHIQSRVYFQAPLHKRYNGKVHCDVTDDLIVRVITLPLHANMSLDDVDKVCDVLLKNA